MEASFAPLGLDRTAVRRQFDRRARAPDAAEFLARDVAARMHERLGLVRIEPARGLDLGCGLGSARPLLQERWPQMQYVGADLAPRRVAQAARALGSWPSWMRWPGRGRSVAFVAADGHALPFDAGSFDLVWSNLALHWFDDRPRALGEWQRVLRPQGVLMFSAWGVDTLVELRRAGVLMPEWPDMHDLGDALLQAGFADPVMETERLTITWSDVRRMVAELRAWGGDARLGRRSGCVTPRQAQRAQEALWAQLCASQGQQTVGLTVELIYGHAWRGGQGVAPEGYAPIQLLRRGV